ncbi:FMN-dependent NADH-azoreductase [Agromyces aurantiacus]|uniref:FMN dependent NADH:quinone oxidoreductase n=1 Tax=Agromyces aurantiacus TaxID=165814 RepID=A0ABV9R5R6_9MICO|nr:NAD(P)H-dependent oxidoreductase [Agromyces aurantiacus]MBM7503645.1 FMN-dependent NADH-azoreductase [Agromyces aurantiacus]
MTTLLHISASPRGEDSESLAIARTFLDAFRAAQPTASVDEWDLWDGSLPSFGPDGAGAKMRIFAGEQPVGTQQVAWHRARLAFERFAAADLYLFSLPMWNAGIPYIAKQFIDVVSQPGMVFGFDPEAGYTGLLRGRRAAVVYTSAVYGDDRPPAFGSDFQRPYFEDWLNWAGVTDVDSVAFRPNLAVADAEPGRRAAHDEARRLGAEFGRSALRRAS